MKKILLLLIAAAANLAMASETVEINKVKYTKYSDAEVRGLIGKMNSIQPDMTVDQLVSIMGKPIREQVVSASPPQRIFVYPLSIMVSLYRNSRSREWQVSAPALYGTPICQREDGIAQKNAIGAEVTEYPSINCIPRRFGPPCAEERHPANRRSGLATAQGISGKRQ